MKVFLCTKVALFVVLILLLLWVGVTTAVFRFRHPWATETELLLYLPKAVMLQRVERPEY